MNEKEKLYPFLFMLVGDLWLNITLDSVEAKDYKVALSIQNLLDIYNGNL
jgi:hypothetical protein